MNKFVDKDLIERLTFVANSEFGHVTYTEAIEILKKNNDNFDYRVEWGTDLQTEHERYLTEQVFKKPVFVTDYPMDIKAFYMRLNDDKEPIWYIDSKVEELEDGKVVFTVKDLEVNEYNVVANYSGDTNYNPFTIERNPIGMGVEKFISRFVIGCTKRRVCACNASRLIGL